MSIPTYLNVKMLKNTSKISLVFIDRKLSLGNSSFPYRFDDFFTKHCVF